MASTPPTWDRGVAESQGLPDKPPKMSVSDYVAEVLKHKIVEGDYLPGMRLIEADITRVFGVSRGPVREAIRRLGAEGLIEYEKHKSPVIRGIGRDQFKQMFEVRSVLEGHAVYLSTRNAHTKDNRRWIESTLAKFENGRCTRSVTRFVAENRLFHDKLAEMAGNPVLTRQIRQLAIPGYNAVFNPQLTAQDVDVSSRQHVDILRAMLRGNAELARDCMIKHTLYTCDRALERFAPNLFGQRMRSLARISTNLPGK